MGRFYDGWRPYVPVGQRRANARREMEKLRKKGAVIEPVEIKGLTIARSFWGKGWCSHLESFGDYSNRLPRGRTYVRNGSVCHLEIRKGEIEAIVSGSELYRIKVEITSLQSAKWKSLKQRCTGKIGSLIELLQGRLSEEIMEVVVDRSNGLFPLPGEIKYTCDCPDWAGMCKHIAAVMYGIGARLDSRPELLFALRGVDHQELISAGAAAGTIAGSGSPRARRRTLAGKDLAGVFGVELEEAAGETEDSRPAKRIKGAGKETPARSLKAKAAGRKAAKSKTSGTEEKPGARGGKGSAEAPRPKARRPTAFKPSARSIAALRRRLNMSKAEFARAVGVSAVSITNWESSKGVLTLHDKSLAGLKRLHATTL